MTGGWEWDETLYAGSAAHYSQGRVPYPPELAVAMAAEIGLDGTGRLLDVGCGPGSLTLLLAPYLAEVVGVDADADMLDRAREQARRAGVTDASWHLLRAEQLPAGLGAFRLVTFAQSFHWFDRPRVAAAVRGMLGPGGACVLVHATTDRGVDGADPLSHPRPPREEISRLVTDYLGPLRRAGRGVLPQGTPGGEDAVFAGAGLSGPHRVELATERVVERTEDDVVASVFSLSRATPALFAGRRRAFEDDLRALLRSVSPIGRFAERMRPVAFDIWRP